MNAIKRHPVFSAWIICCAVLAAGGTYWLLRLRHSVRHESASLVRKIQLRDQLRLQARLPEPEHGAPSADLSTVAPKIEPGEIPRKPFDAFIALVTAREEWRRLAASRWVALLPDESFGLATYAHQGPPADQLAAVDQQLGLTRLLLEKLFAARPEKLLAVRREKPPSSGPDGLPEVGADFFQLDPRLDLRLAGLIEGQALRLEFTGRTPVLRDWLNSLATAPESLVVRSVEVEPCAGAPAPAGDCARFSVVVEQLRMTAPFADQARLVRLPPPTLWAAVPGHPENPEHLYELFATPGSSKRALERAPLVVDRRPLVGLELLAVKREAYRLQLVGYYGPREDYTAAFVSPGLPGTMLARVGHRFDSLGLILRDFAVKKITPEPGPEHAGYELTASAQVWDERNQELVTLVAGQPLLTATPLAVLRTEPPPARPREFHAGDSFPDGAATWRIDHIQLDPAEVVLVRTLPGVPQPERRVLHPAAPAAVASTNFDSPRAPPEPRRADPVPPDQAR